MTGSFWHQVPMNGDEIALAVRWETSHTDPMYDYEWDCFIEVDGVDVSFYDRLRKSEERDIERRVALQIKNETRSYTV